MSSTPPRQNSHSILQAKIEEAIDKHDNDPYNKKRKNSDQNSAEKTKSSKQPNLNTKHNQTQPLNPIYNPTPHLIMEANDDNWSKMLRMPAKDLISIKCATAHSTRDTILKKDTHHINHELVIRAANLNNIWLELLTDIIQLHLQRNPSTQSQQCFKNFKINIMLDLSDIRKHIGPLYNNQVTIAKTTTSTLPHTK